MAIKGELAYWEAEDFGTQLIDLTLGDLLDQRAQEQPDKEALVYNYPETGLDLRLTYGQYRDIVNRVAKGLIAIGIGEGDHVAVCATNVPEWIFLQLAVAKIGAVIVTVNTNYRGPEIEYVLRQGDIHTLFLIEGHRGNNYLESIYNAVPELKSLSDPLNQKLECSTLPRLRRVVLIGPDLKPGMLSYPQVVELGEKISDDELKTRQASVSPHDVTMMQYTSGTTGFPKGVMLTHHNLINQAHVACTRGDLSDKERYVTAMPLFHIAGSLGGTIYCLYLGCTLIPLISFDPLKHLELFEREKGTFTFAVPTMLIAILNHPRFAEFDLSVVRNFYTGVTRVSVP